MVAEYFSTVSSVNHSFSFRAAQHEAIDCRVALGSVVEAPVNLLMVAVLAPLFR